MDPFQQALKALEELEDTLLEAVAMECGDFSMMEVAESAAFFAPEEVEAFMAALDLELSEE